MTVFSTGQIFFIGGMAGLLVAFVATVVSLSIFHKKEKRLKEEIWNEYR